LLFGYRTFYLKEYDIVRAANALLRFGICAEIDGCRINAPLNKLSRFERAFSGMDYELSEVRGLYGMLGRGIRRYGALAALALLIVIYAFSSGRVWDIRIEGCSQYNEDGIVCDLERAGLSVGARWRDINFDSTELSVLSENDGIAWININRSASVAYVKVKEKASVPDEDTSGYCNIVATEDCVIEEITVRCGIAAVAPGDTVKKGDLLISGVIPAELGGGFVSAQGRVVGRVHKSVSVAVGRSEEKLEISSSETVGITLKILGFSLNIFKKGGNSLSGYDIIEDKKIFSVLGGAKLPLEIITERAVFYSPKEVRYSDSQLVNIASMRLTAVRAAFLRGSDMLGIRTGGHFTESGYEMTSEIYVLSDVCRKEIFG
jgi:similar to stage IV sporulation protein